MNSVLVLVLVINWTLNWFPIYNLQYVIIDIFAHLVSYVFEMSGKGWKHAHHHSSELKVFKLLVLSSQQSKTEGYLVYSNNKHNTRLNIQKMEAVIFGIFACIKKGWNK